MVTLKARHEIEIVLVLECLIDTPIQRCFHIFVIEIFINIFFLKSKFSRKGTLYRIVSKNFYDSNFFSLTKKEMYVENPRG